VLDAARSTTPAPGVAARVLSSGTGGPRKPIDLTAENLFASAGASAKRLSTGPGDVWLACLPMDHVGGLSILWRSWLGAHAALIHPRFDAEAVAESLASSSPRVTAISLVPTQLARLLDAGADLSGLRFALIGGAALPPALLERALDAGVPVAATYGLTEACSQVTTLPPSEARSRAGSSGRALPGTEVRIGHGKRIEVRGPTVAPGASGRDGWLRTGDIGRLDEDGYLWVEGRADDVIVSGGENVRPEPIEDRLREHPRVKDAAVVGVPDPEWGQAVVAFVAGPAGPAEPLVAHCRETLPPPSVPKRIEFVDEVPRTASGKLQRARLRAAAQGL
jgi:o-succinylbenzoate---CoA ligase